LIKSITRELNTALILITHNLGTVARYARRVYVMYGGMIMEHGTAMDVYHTPCHPYTAGLLASVPRLDEPRKTRLVPIEGQPPDLIFPPGGCLFQPRCAYQVADCSTGRPPLLEVGPQHFSSCLLAHKGIKEWQTITSLK